MQRSKSLGFRALPWASALLALLLLLSAPACQRTKPSPKKARPTAPASLTEEQLERLLVKIPAELEATDGARLLGRIKQSPAKGTFVNVWASWCGSCKHEMPRLLELKKRYADKGIEFLFVSVDELKEAAAAAALLKELKMPTPALIVEGPIDAFKQAMSPRWQGALPVSFLFDAGGELRYIWPGEVFDREVTPILEDLLAGKPVSGSADIKTRQRPREPKSQ